MCVRRTVAVDCNQTNDVLCITLFRDENRDVLFNHSRKKYFFCRPITLFCDENRDVLFHHALKQTISHVLLCFVMTILMFYFITHEKLISYVLLCFGMKIVMFYFIITL